MSRPTLPAKRKAQLRMPLRELRSLVEAIIPATASDDMTPVLHGALFRLDAGRVAVAATDRYRVHRVRGKYEGSKAGTFLVPVEALKWIVKNATFFRGYSTVPTARLDFEYEEAAPNDKDTPIPAPKGSVTVTLTGGIADSTLAYSLPLIEGRYPNVEDLLVKALALDPVAAESHVNLKFLTDANKLADYKGQVGEIRVVPSSSNNKAPTMLVIFERGEVLIQTSDAVTR
ncbi:MAG: hypothetical protein ABI067_17800 [Leifsonia sp.]